ncbi:class E sortase [Actinophytocola sp. S1-96]|uniref:Class E sortase n=1 Tax=Actinophytocola gossypii TaxID=2812003 RepID=A0ABT2JFA9_9PSEU|nr:class E sortase [Actinophytocola gossypii]
MSGDLGELAPSPRPRSGPPPGKPDKTQRVVRGVGEALITLGMVVLLFVVYEVYITDLISAGKQREAAAELDDRWSDPTIGGGEERQDHFGQFGEGEGFAKMHIPKFGADFHFTVVEGTTAPSLEIGPGHYTDTAYPGEPGNFSVAGHRVGKGAPFNDINLIESCDAIVVETQYTWFVYRMVPLEEEKAGWAQGKGKDPRCEGVLLGGVYEGLVGQRIVLPTNGDVIAPIPTDPTSTASAGESASLLTLTTCHPRFSDKERLIVHSVLTNEYPKDPSKPDWRPPAFEEIT